MLKVDHISVMNLENAIRGARNPLNSWARSDSCYNETGEYVQMCIRDRYGTGEIASYRE